MCGALSDVFTIGSVTSKTIDLSWVPVQDAIYTISSTPTPAANDPVTQVSLLLKFYRLPYFTATTVWRIAIICFDKGISYISQNISRIRHWA